MSCEMRYISRPAARLILSMSVCQTAAGLSAVDPGHMRHDIYRLGGACCSPRSTEHRVQSTTAEYNGKECGEEDSPVACWHAGAMYSVLSAYTTRVIMAMSMPMPMPMPVAACTVRPGVQARRRAGCTENERQS